MTPESLRVKLWREANKERYNASQRELMAKRRAKKKAEKVAAPSEEKSVLSVTIIPYKP